MKPHQAVSDLESLWWLRTRVDIMKYFKMVTQAAASVTD